MDTLIQKIDETILAASRSPDDCMELCFVAFGMCKAFEIVYGNTLLIQSKKGELENLIDSLDSCVCEYMLN